MENTQDEVITLKQEIERQKQIIQDLETRLKKYTTNPSYKNYYENNKDKVKESQKKYLQKLKDENPEKLKEYYQKANQRKKEKRLLQSSTTQQN